MKNLVRLLFVTALAIGLSACLFKEPVFTSGFGKVDASLAGVWMAEGEDGDPRERQFAVVTVIGDAYLLHYPVNDKGAIYYEARPVKAGERELLQVRVAASFEDGIPGKDVPIYNILWLKKDAAADSFSVRTLKHEGPQTESAAAAKKALEDKGGDWEKLFGEAVVFKRLPNK